MRIFPAIGRLREASRRLVAVCKPAMTVCIMALLACPAGAHAGLPDYSRLFEWIEIADHTTPLVVFTDLDTEFDADRHRENLDYLNNNPQLIENIKSQLDGSELRWKIGHSAHRLLIVPEKRAEYAELYENYCREAIDYVLDKVEFENPYAGIVTPSGPLDLEPAGSSSALTVYLVHNVAEEYVEEYIFFTETDKRAKVRLSQKNFTGKTGTYASDLHIGPEGDVGFIRRNYTIWQNSADNPFDVAIVPVEETIHVLLRAHTEDAIQTSLTAVQPENASRIEEIVNEWVSIEEAVVGGLVFSLMPEVYRRHFRGRGAFPAKKVIAKRNRKKRYRYLENGIRMVETLGFRTVLNLYRTDPDRVRKLLAGPSTP